MAALATASEIAHMYVVLLVTTIACLRQIDLLHRLFMAGITMQVLVRTVQFEFGLLVMIELPYVPRIWIMAGSTFWP